MKKMQVIPISVLTLLLLFSVEDVFPTSSWLQRRHFVKKVLKTRKERLHSVTGRAKIVDVLEQEKLDPESNAENEAERGTVALRDGNKKSKNAQPDKKYEAMDQQHDRHPVKHRAAVMSRLRSSNDKQKRNYVEDAVLWTNNRIPFTIEESTFGPYAGKAIQLIKEAATKIKEYTCVEWIPKTSESNYVKFVGNNKGCWSYIGNINEGAKGQLLNLESLDINDNCLYLDTVFHEMMHAMGSTHEQQRTDREGNIKILWNNIEKENIKEFYSEVAKNRFPYDYNSIMQYRLDTFAKSSLRAMSIPDTDLEYLITNTKNGLPFYDIAEINQAYNCTGTCNITCKNGGQSIKPESVCECMCPEGLTGSDCSELETTEGCGEIIHLSDGQSKEIKLQPYQTGMKCTWLIKGQTRIKVIVEAIDLPYSSQMDCYHWVEFRDYLIGDIGKELCGDTGGSVYTKKLIGDPSRMMIRFDSQKYGSHEPGKGFILKVLSYKSGCASFPCNQGQICVDEEPTGAFTCKCTAGYSGKTCNVVSASTTTICNFENDFENCIFAQKQGDLEWSLSINDVGQNRIGEYQFICMDPIGFTYYGTKAHMITSVQFEATVRCLSFAYVVMNNDPESEYGTQINVYYEGSNIQKETLLAIQKHTDDKWVTAYTNVPSVEDLKLTFEGVFGVQPVAVDNIQLAPGSCVLPCAFNPCMNDGTCVVSGSTYKCTCPSGVSGINCQTREGYACNFESEDDPACFLEQSSNGDYDWKLWWGYTRTRGTGPTGAQNGTYFALADAREQKSGDRAVLTSFPVFKSNTYCLKFYYTMFDYYDTDMGSLAVKTTSDSTKPVTLWKQSGNHGQTWSLHKINITLNSQTKILIEAERGSGVRSDVAIDSVKLDPGYC